MRNWASFRRSLDHGQYVIELHAWSGPETTTFATFVYENRHSASSAISPGADENEVIRQAVAWCEENS